MEHKQTTLSGLWEALSHLLRQARWWAIFSLKFQLRSAVDHLTAVRLPALEARRVLSLSRLHLQSQFLLQAELSSKPLPFLFRHSVTKVTGKSADPFTMERCARAMRLLLVALTPCLLSIMVFRTRCSVTSAQQQPQFYLLFS